MRPLPILYGILLKYFKKNANLLHFNCHGVCYFIDVCPGLTVFEAKHLKADFHANRPSYGLHTKHMDKERSWTSFWWDLDEKGNKQRIKFLKHMIKYHENNTRSV